MNLRWKILILPLTAAIVFVAGSTVSVGVGISTSASLGDLQQQAYPFKEATDRFAVGVEAFRAAVQAAATEGDETKVDDAKATAKALREDLERMAAMPDAAVAAKGLKDALINYEPAALQAALAMAGKGEAGDAVKRMTEGKAALDKRVAEVKALAAQTVVARAEETAQGVRRNLQVLFATGGLTLVALGVASVLVIRSVWTDLGEEPGTLRGLTDRIADGDLAAFERAHARDGSLYAALARMASRLQGIVAEVRSNAESVATASAQIAQGNSDLSTRTEQQASSLQETASTMEQLGSTVRNNADSARQANQLAQSASGVAQQGGGVVAEVVQTMRGINESSRRIAEIIGTIDGIAFQTNILALNAAVEAARAGENGRGFAVVAGEVRNLAQRSAEAAREIKSLIGASVERVEQGTALVDQAGTTMQEVVSSIRRVADIVGEISMASGDQADGVAQVGSAVADMDRSTQQNAALVEESAAAAESLKKQALQLLNAVAVFKLDGVAAG
ncbi:MAG: chemotaxis protein [Burkholderiales bacterium]|nr:chemotaxis protein [Burkholderiales bacterium]